MQASAENCLLEIKYLNKMKFSIVQKIDQRFLSLTTFINSLSNEISFFLSEKDYGSHVKEIVVGLNCVQPPQGYEHLFKLKKPFYVDNKSIINKYTGEVILLEKYFFYDFKVSDILLAKFETVSDFEKNKIIVKELIESFDLINNLPKKVKDFDLAKFKNDLEDYLKERNFI